jgi:hypothetical protein
LVVVFAVYLHRQQREEAARLEAFTAALTREVTALRGAVQDMPTARPLAPVVWTAGHAPSAAPFLAASTAPPSRTAAPLETAMPPRTAQQEAAVTHARELLANAVHSGRLRRDDVIAMREELARGGNPEARRELVQQIVLALNAQQLAPEDRHFIFP